MLVMVSAGVGVTEDPCVRRTGSKNDKLLYTNFHMQRYFLKRSVCQ